MTDLKAKLERCDALARKPILGIPGDPSYPSEVAQRESAYSTMHSLLVNAYRSGQLIVAPVWQPIETAPRKGQYLVFQPPHKAQRTTLAERICFNDEAGAVRLTTHWMPLPSPPKGDE